MPMQRLTSKASAERHAELESHEANYHGPATEEAELRSALDDLESAAASGHRASLPPFTVRPRLPR